MVASLQISSLYQFQAVVCVYLLVLTLLPVTAPGDQNCSYPCMAYTHTPLRYPHAGPAACGPLLRCCQHVRVCGPCLCLSAFVLDCLSTPRLMAPWLLGCLPLVPPCPPRPLCPLDRSCQDAAACPSPRAMRERERERERERVSTYKSLRCANKVTQGTFAEPHSQVTRTTLEWLQPLGHGHRQDTLPPPPPPPPSPPVASPLPTTTRPFTHSFRGWGEWGRPEGI